MLLLYPDVHWTLCGIICTVVWWYNDDFGLYGVLWSCYDILLTYLLFCAVSRLNLRLACRMLLYNYDSFFKGGGGGYVCVNWTRVLCTWMCHILMQPLKNNNNVTRSPRLIGKESRKDVHYTIRQECSTVANNTVLFLGNSCHQIITGNYPM